jgi:TolA-binding protein
MVPLRRAQVLAQQRQWPEARAMAEKIRAAYPDFAQQYEADYVIGRALAAQADFDGARAAYGKVIQSATGGKTETAAMAQWMIGETYFHQENYEAALREYLRVEILYAYPRWQAAALLQAGKCQELLRHPAEAVQLYARLIKLGGDTDFSKEGAARMRALEGK